MPFQHKSVFNSPYYTQHNSFMCYLSAFLCVLCFSAKAPNRILQALFYDGYIAGISIYVYVSQFQECIFL